MLSRLLGVGLVGFNLQMGAEVALWDIYQTNGFLAISHLPRHDCVLKQVGQLFMAAPLGRQQFVKLAYFSQVQSSDGQLPFGVKHT